MASWDAILDGHCAAGTGVLIQQAASDMHNVDGPERPAGLGYLSQSLIREGLSHTVVDLNQPQAPERLEGAILNAAWVGLSSYSFDYPTVYRLCDTIRGVRPKVPIILGGAHAACMGGEIFRQCESIDFVAYGEAEMSLPKLLRGDIEVFHPTGNILCRDQPREDGLPVSMGKSAFPEDLDALPFPLYSNFVATGYSETIPLVTSRGCPQACSFCLGPVISQRRTRSRSIASVIDEMEYWYTRGFRKFSILDDNFAAHRRRAVEFAETILRKNLKYLSIFCSVGLRSDTVDRDLLDLLVQAGMKSFSVGVESGNDFILKKIAKGASVSAAERVIELAQERRVDVALNFLIGLPEETEETVRDSIALARRHPFARSRFFHLIPFPRTAAYDWVCQHGEFVGMIEEWLSHASVWENRPCFHTHELTLEARRRLWSVANNQQE